MKKFKLLSVLIIVAVMISSCGIPSAGGAAAGDGAAAVPAVAAGAFEGQYHDVNNNSISLDIWKSDDGVYHVRYINPVTTNISIYYECTGSVNGSVLSYEDGVRTDVTYDADGEADEDQVYAEATGRFELKGGNITWKDDKEDLGNGLAFVPM